MFRSILPPFSWRRRIALLVAALGGIWTTLVLLAWILAPEGSPETATATADPEAAALVAARAAVPDLANPLVLWQDVDYSEGASAAWYPKGEAPILQDLVNEGKLPPVAERVGSEPLVLKGVDGIGNYGGTWIEATWALSRLNQINRSYSYSNLARWSPEGYPVVPHVAKGWEVSDDQKVFTIFLRRGMRWSDGHPFTADDIMYWYEYEVLDPTLGIGEFNRGLLEHVRGTGTVRRVDDYTVQFVFDRPNGTFIQQMASVLGNAPVNSPRHYLLPYHPGKGDPELIEETRHRLGLPSARALYERLKRADNPEHPRLWPWIYQTYRASPPFGFVRNPYYFAVDTEGNQLPYFDRFHWELKSPELLGIAAANGELTLQTIWPPLNQYTLLMSNRKSHGYSIRHWYPSARSSMVINPNLNRKILPEDPASRWKHRLLTDKRFRKALSLAIDRQAIIDTAFSGLGVPSQVEPGPGSAFHSEKLARAYIDYAPDRAAALLDEIGLTQRDREGLRTFPDGTRMEFYLHTIAAQDTGAMQLIVEDWARVGVRGKILVRSQSLWRSEIAALVHDFSVAESLSEFIPTNNPRPFVPWGSWSDYAQGYALWFQRGGMWDDPRSRSLATQGPAPDDPIYRAMELYNEVRQAPTREAQVAIFEEIFEIAAENLWTINIATAPPYLVLVKDGVRNVPEFAVAGNHHYTPGSAGLETYFLENPSVTPAGLDHMRAELTTPGRLPAEMAVEGGTGRHILLWVLGAGALIGLLSLAIRHPFVARRMALMVPTLAVISILTFIIIQLPPGDYLTTLALRLQEEGSEASEQQIRELRELFHLDEHPVSQYLHWSGLAWFTSFAPEDRGLLQGNLGRSMETLRPVNSVVGDRILLTVLISAGTILFTWALAIPIGIYSAVRPYSPGDYTATLVGLAGMSVPNFLLAILAMYFASRLGDFHVTGLFSPKYAVQPGWSGGKVIDLLKHIWVPVLILGIGGTASMVRVMRGNLLDELSRPYVRTARAKGMKPWRLILKYPVRLALNPFVSGIGTLFPQLISGGAITAVILSLPTIGPLMLEAFRSEDMFLAGSMLMVLSFLGIFGTLVSDLLLLALDPRIRMERSGSR